jgi:hypothetical protein
MTKLITKVCPSSDRIRTTNNMLGDCYCSAIVEHLSRKELMACDSVSFYQNNSPVNSNAHIPSGEKEYAPELIVVDLSTTATAGQKDQKQSV